MKARGIVTGAAVALWFCIAQTILFFDFEYTPLSILLYYILPALSGVIIILLLRCDSMGSFYICAGECILVSLVLILLFEISGLPSILYSWFSDYNEISLGHGILLVMIIQVHTVACIIGMIVSGSISFYRQKRHA